MSITTARGLAAAGLLATTLTGVVAVGAPAQAAEWKSERGNVIECQGRKAGLTVRTTVYENHRYGNTVQATLGDPDLDIDGARQTTDKFLVDGVVRATVNVDGKRLVVKGTASRYGARIAVSESFDDGDMTVTTRGYQRNLRTDLVAKYDGKVVPLTCDTAFYYNLEVKRTPIN
jgi:aryl-phospho-beta-D-glucosidase BglC (GH1 family)